MIPQLIWTNEADGSASYFNRRWFEYSGLSYEESVGPGWQVMVHPDDAPASVSRWQRALAAGEVFDTEYRLRRADGVYCWHIGRNVPLRDNNGRITGWFGTATDVEDLKQTQALLQESEERLRLMLESATDYAIISFSTEGIIKEWSSGAERIFGYTEKEAIGQPGDIVFTPEDRAAGAPQMEMKQAREEGRAADERWHIRRDGTRFYMSGVMSPISDSAGKLTGFVKVARDMTGQQTAAEALLQSEAALRHAEEQLRLALSASAIGIWIRNMHNDAMQWSKEQEALFGLEPGTFGGTLEAWKQGVHPDDLPAVLQQYDEAIRNSEQVQTEYRAVWPDGSIHWLLGKARAYYNAAGQPEYMMGANIDITARKALEQQKDEFIGIASHELKTPLTSIKAYTEVLLDMFGEAEDHVSASLVGKLDKQIDRLTELIRALLDVTKIREGKLEFRLEPFDLNGLVTEIVEDMQRTTRHRLELVPAPVGDIYADRERIGQVLTNLLSNAIKYSPNADRVVITTHADAGEAVISVQDFGIGMSQEVSEKIFDRFYRSDEASISTYPGLGLGLYISAEIIHRHGGRIRVDSRQGSGSIFYCSLPLSGPTD